METQIRFEPPLSWAAIFAGAVVALAVSILLTLLASGLGYSVAGGILAGRTSFATFTPELGAAAIAVQVISAGFGGYLAGRLRHPWPSAHLDEAHFRDTAQGLIAWALATVAGLLFASAITSPAAIAAAAVADTAALDPVRAANLLAQSAFFTATGMLLAAFTAAVAGRIGGLRSEHMHEQRPVVVTTTPVAAAPVVAAPLT
jgi:hypothetical protein